jgi:ubiquinone/menaquinone biosynthesis C-methylase UbiE
MPRIAIVTIWLLASVAAAERAEAQPAAKAGTSSRYSHRTDHDPNGIGKFYMGREIAHVMGYLGAPWLERRSREKEEKLSVLVKSLELKPGMVVADIGAGSGVISALMAEKVGPDGHVIAVDVQQKMLDRLKGRMKTLGIKNVRPNKGTQKSPKLKPGTVDLVLMADVYHEFEWPYEMTLELCKALKPGGRLVFVEYRKEDPAVPIKEVHKMSQAQVKKEMAQPEFGMAYQKTIGTLPRQHIIVFVKKKPANRNGKPGPGEAARAGRRISRSRAMLTLRSGVPLGSW